jgi:hypothetical protein
MLMAVLQHLEVVDKDKAEALAKKLRDSIQPDRYKDAVEIVKQVFDEVEKGK